MSSPLSIRKALAIALAAVMATALAHANEPSGEPETKLRIFKGGEISYDGATGRISISNVRFEQDDFGLRADLGEGSLPGSEDQSWHFTGNVRIRAFSATLTCNSAELKFKKGRLERAIILGDPVVMRNEGELIADGRAGRVEYEAESALVRLLGGATLETPATRMSGESITFDLRSEAIIVSPGEGEDKRVEFRIDFFEQGQDEEP